MFAAGFAKHGGQPRGADGRLHSFPWRETLGCIQKPKIFTLFGYSVRFGKIPTGRDASAMRSNLFLISHWLTIWQKTNG
jgi:hypothetical protein